MLTEMLGTDANTPWKASSKEEEESVSNPLFFQRVWGALLVIWVSLSVLYLMFSPKGRLSTVCFHCGKRLELWKGSEVAGRGAGGSLEWGWWWIGCGWFLDRPLLSHLPELMTLLYMSLRRQDLFLVIWVCLTFLETSLCLPESFQLTLIECPCAVCQPHAGSCSLVLALDINIMLAHPCSQTRKGLLMASSFWSEIPKLSFGSCSSLIKLSCLCLNMGLSYLVSLGGSRSCKADLGATLPPLWWGGKASDHSPHQLDVSKGTYNHHYCQGNKECI